MLGPPRGRCPDGRRRGPRGRRSPLVCLRRPHPPSVSVCGERS